MFQDDDDRSGGYEDDDYYGEDDDGGDDDDYGDDEDVGDRDDDDVESTTTSKSVFDEDEFSFTSIRDPEMKDEFGVFSRTEAVNEFDPFVTLGTYDAKEKLTPEKEFLRDIFLLKKAEFKGVKDEQFRVIRDNVLKLPSWKMKNHKALVYSYMCLMNNKRDVNLELFKYYTTATDRHTEIDTIPPGELCRYVALWLDYFNS